MARGGDRDRKRTKGPGKDAGRRTKKKVCIFCKEHIDWVDYKDVNLLRRFMSDRGKIRARRVSGNCAQHQRDVAVAIKTARELALLPYTQRTVAERGGRGGRGGPPPMAERPQPAVVLEDSKEVDAAVDVDDVVDATAEAGEGREEPGLDAAAFGDTASTDDPS